MPNGTSAPRVAVVHDYLTQRGGAERVVLALMRAFPGARLLASVYDRDATYPEFGAYDVETTWLNRLPALRRDPRRALPFLAPTFSRMQVHDVDVVICSSSGWAHGVRTSAPKIVYCYNPPRWLYQHEDYVAAQHPTVRVALAALRRPLEHWDRAAAATATRYLTSSSVVRERVRRAYGIQARILPPPVGLDPEGPRRPVAGLTPGFFLVVGRGRGYKNISLVGSAFGRLPAERLVVVGGAPDPSWPANVTALHDVHDDELRWLYASCTAVVAASHEDFGLTPLEGNAFGRPALVLEAGGFLDTLAEGVSGEWIRRPDAGSVIEAVHRCRARTYDEAAIRAHAARFSEPAFAVAMREQVAEVLAGRQ